VVLIVGVPCSLGLHACTAVQPSPVYCRASGGALDMRDVEATELALRQGVRLVQDAVNGTKFDAQQQVSAQH
jgi:hypothetical protein